MVGDASYFLGCFVNANNGCMADGRWFTSPFFIPHPHPPKYTQPYEVRSIERVWESQVWWSPKQVEFMRHKLPIHLPSTPVCVQVTGYFTSYLPFIPVNCKATNLFLPLIYLEEKSNWLRLVSSSILASLDSIQLTIHSHFNCSSAYLFTSEENFFNLNILQFQVCNPVWSWSFPVEQWAKVYLLIFI